MAVQRSEHAQKFDRQMRLWGAHGQERLESARVGVLHATATACEALKNLVLPSLGSFVLIDDAIAAPVDMGSNFFIDQAALGTPRAVAAAQRLLELNPAVKGLAKVESVANVINSKLDMLNSFDLVLASQLSEQQTLRLASHLDGQGIPLLVVQTSGLLSQIRLQVPELCIVETHPTVAQHDLFLHPRQLERFPELVAYAASFGEFKELSDEAHAHVPYPVILIHAGRHWLQTHDTMPQSYEDKVQFKQHIRAMARDPTDENFEEAVANAVRAYELPRLGHQAQAVLDDAKATTLSANSSHFWILARAVRDFVAHEGNGVILPATTSIPDMKAETNRYVALKSLYAARAVRDAKAVDAHVRRLLATLGKPLDDIPTEHVAFFVRHVRELGCVRTRPIATQQETLQAGQETIGVRINEAMDEWEPTPEADEVLPPKPIFVYLALRAAALYRDAHGVWPGADASLDAAALKTQTAQLHAIQCDMATRLGVGSVPLEQCAMEVVRSGHLEVHNTAAFMGGLAAQVALKILLQQYVPLNNTFVWNGVFATSKTYEL